VASATFGPFNRLAPKLPRPWGDRVCRDVFAWINLRLSLAGLRTASRLPRTALSSSSGDGLAKGEATINAQQTAAKACRALVRIG
jgi:hypothetical protein